MRTLLLVTALALGAGVAQADNGLFYLGAGITGNHVNHLEVQGFDNFPNINSTSWQAFAGMRPIRLFAVEADYLDLGSEANTFDSPLSCVSHDRCAVTWESDAKAFAGYAVGFLPIPLPYVDVYGKAGLARYEWNGTFTSYNALGVLNGSSAKDSNGTVFTWGAGVQAHVGIIGARLEYEGFNKASTSVFSLSVFLNLK
jgi:opacity protein-like surface antigen